MYDVSIWTSTEIYVALICAAAPGVKPLISRMLPKLLGTSLRSRTRPSGGSSNAIELSLKMKRSTKSNSTTNLTSAQGPYSEIYSPAKHDEESLDGKSDMDEGPGRMKVEDGIVRNTSVVIKSERRM